jgi:hypothetical protein
MLKIENVIDSIYSSYGSQSCGESSVYAIVKEYAEYYAERCLKIAADNAQIESFDLDKGIGVIYKKSITGIELPPHE